MTSFDDILSRLNGSIVSIDGRRVVKIYQDEDGRYHAYRMPRCSIGDYFAVLSWLIDENGRPPE